MLRDLGSNRHQPSSVVWPTSQTARRVSQSAKARASPAALAEALFANNSAKTPLDLTEADIWFGLYVPAKTPRQSVSQLSGWFSAALEVPEVKAKLVGLGLFPMGMCGVDFSALVRKKYEEYGHTIREFKIKVN
jgi:hypothetical protein